MHSYLACIALKLFCVCHAGHIPTAYEEIINVCPVSSSFFEEQEHITLAERKGIAADKAMTTYLLQHPTTTLWEYFVNETKDDYKLFQSLTPKNKLRTAALDVANFAADTTIGVVDEVAYVVTGLVNTIRHPVAGYLQLRDFIQNFVGDCKLLGKVMRKEPKTTLKNLGGGMLIHLKHHPAEFTAESIVLLSGGSAVIHGLMAGVEAMFSNVGPTASAALTSALWFVHMLDDPILLVMPIVQRTLETNAEVHHGTEKAEPLSMDIIQPLPECQIPIHERVPFSANNLCLGTTIGIRKLIFGTEKRYFDMNANERLEAFRHYRLFECCYLPDQKYKITNTKAVEAEFSEVMKSFMVYTKDCPKLQLIPNSVQSFPTNAPAQAAPTNPTSNVSSPPSIPSSVPNSVHSLPTIPQVNPTLAQAPPTDFYSMITAPPPTPNSVPNTLTTSQVIPSPAQAPPADPQATVSSPPSNSEPTYVQSLPTTTQVIPAPAQATPITPQATVSYPSLIN